MRRWALVLLFCFLAFPAVGQIGKIKWTCPEKGRFRVAHCANCPYHYCYDGQHFFEEDGPVPGWVKSYFDNMLAKMEQDRAEIQRHVQEGQMHSPQGRSNVLRPAAQTFPVERAASPSAAPKPAPVERFQAIKIGMERSQVIENLGTPQSSLSIPDENGVTETLNFVLTDNRWVKVIIQNGKVTEIKAP